MIWEGGATPKQNNIHGFAAVKYTVRKVKGQLP